MSSSEQRLSAESFQLVEGRHWDVDPETNCWIWKKFAQRGYGRTTGVGWAHRQMWIQAGRELPPRGWHLHHTCETRLCVNPDHLRVMSPSEHLAMHKQAASCLTAADVVSIRERAMAGEKLSEIGPEFGVNEDTIGLIVRGLTWRNVGGPIGQPSRACVNCGADLSARSRLALYCSNACRQAVWVKRNGRPSRKKVAA